MASICHIGDDLALHQMVSRGHDTTLKPVLRAMRRVLGQDKLAELLNHKTGKEQNLGCCDLALKTKQSMVPMLKEYGAVEQTTAPASWKPNRRRSEQSAEQPPWASGSQRAWAPEPAEQHPRASGSQQTWAPASGSQQTWAPSPWSQQPWAPWRDRTGHW